MYIIVLLQSLHQEEASQLEQENDLLKAEVTQLKRQLVEQEIRNGGISNINS